MLTIPEDPSTTGDTNGTTGKSAITRSLGKISNIIVPHREWVGRGYSVLGSKAGLVVVGFWGVGWLVRRQLNVRGCIFSRRADYLDNR